MPQGKRLWRPFPAGVEAPAGLQDGREIGRGGSADAQDAVATFLFFLRCGKGRVPHDGDLCFPGCRVLPCPPLSPGKTGTGRAKKERDGLAVRKISLPLHPQTRNGATRGNAGAIAQMVRAHDS